MEEVLLSRVLLCFRIVSVSTAAKLSAVVNRDGDSLAPADQDPGPPASDASELETESELGDRDRELRRIGRGAGMGGLLAKGPVGKSMTRSGVVLEVLLTRGVVRDPQLCPGFSSPALVILRLSHKSFLRRKLLPLDVAPVGVESPGFASPVATSGSAFLTPAPAPHRLLPQGDCLTTTLLVSCCSESFLTAGVTAAVVATLGLAPSSGLSPTINDCLCSGTGVVVEDILLSGVSLMDAEESFLWIESVGDGFLSTVAGVLSAVSGALSVVTGKFTGESFLSGTTGVDDTFLTPTGGDCFFSTKRLTGDKFLSTIFSSGPESFLPTPCLDPAGRLASSAAMSPVPMEI